MSQIITGPLTTSLTRTLAPDLLLNELDSRIVKVRPSSTPLDQISRMAPSRRAKAMKVDYYSVDTRETVLQVNKVETATGYEDGHHYVLRMTNADSVQPTETLLMPDCKNEQGHPAVLYVEKVNGREVTVLLVDDETGVPSTLTGKTVIRMGRAAGELDVQTPSFSALPKKESNNCQIFKAQIEQSTVQRITNKEVGWTLNDQEEVAVIDMRMGMEKSFLFGVKAVVADSVKQEDISLTGGIWHQAGSTFNYTTDADPAEVVVALARKAFVGNDSSRRKVLLGGSDLIEKLSRLDVVRAAGPATVKSHWGIDFTELVTKFGRLYVMHSEVFDHCGMPANGMVIDPEYLTKYSFLPMHVERLDLKKSGQRNTDAVVITEASCLVLRYPNAHLRIVAQEPAAPETTENS